MKTRLRLLPRIYLRRWEILLLAVGLIAATYASLAWIPLTSRERVESPTFVVVEGSDAFPAATLLPHVERVVHRSHTRAELLPALSLIGSVRELRFGARRIYHIQAPEAQTGVLDQVVEIERFVGSPGGVLELLSRQSGVPIRGGVGAGAIVVFSTDATSRVEIAPFRGPLRNLLAASIPAGYPIVAMSVECREGGHVYVTHVGCTQHDANAHVERLSNEEMVLEGSRLALRQGETLVDAAVRSLRERGLIRSAPSVSP